MNMALTKATLWHMPQTVPYATPSVVCLQYLRLLCRTIHRPRAHNATPHVGATSCPQPAWARVCALVILMGVFKHYVSMLWPLTGICSCVQARHSFAALSKVTNAYVRNTDTRTRVLCVSSFRASQNRVDARLHRQPVALSVQCLHGRCTPCQKDVYAPESHIQCLFFDVKFCNLHSRPSLYRYSHLPGGSGLVWAVDNFPQPPNNMDVVSAYYSSPVFDLPGVNLSHRPWVHREE